MQVEAKTTRQVSWVVFVALLCGAVPARADVVLQSFVGARTKDGARVVDQFLDEAQAQGLCASRECVARALGSRLPRAGSEPNKSSADLARAFAEAQATWRAQPPEAELLRVIKRAADMGFKNPALIVADLSRREAFKRVLISLALVHKRMGDVAQAEEIERELLRAYPDEVVTPSVYGAEAASWYQTVTAAETKRGRGTLTISVDDPNVQCYVDEMIRRTNAPLADLAPGSRRVLCMDGKNRSVLYEVEVLANQDAVVPIEWAIDSTVVSDPYIGLLFQTETERKQEFAAASRYARGTGGSVVVLGIQKSDRGPELVASRVSLGTKRVLRRATVQLGTKEDERRVRALARFVAHGQQSPLVAVIDAPDLSRDDAADRVVAVTPVADVERMPVAPMKPMTADTTSNLVGHPYVAPGIVAGAGLATFGVGLVLAITYQRPAMGPQSEYIYATPALGLMIAGGLATVAGTSWFFYRFAGRPSKAPSSTPVVDITPRGAFIGWARRY